MIFTIALNYNIKDSVEDSRESTINIITTGLRTIYPSGMSDSQLRILGRIQRKFDEAITNKSETIDVEMAELDLCKKAVRDGRFDPTLAKYILLLEEELDKVK